MWKNPFAMSGVIRPQDGEGYQVLVDSRPEMGVYKKLVLKDDRKACRYGLRGAQFFLKSMAFYYYTNDRPTGRVRAMRDFHPEDQLDRFMQLRNTAGSELSSVIGDPDCARAGATGAGLRPSRRSRELR